MTHMLTQDVIATPTGECYLWDSMEAYTIEVTPINGWSPKGDSLNDEESGCGALTEWQYGTWSNGTGWATFNLPLFIKSGCIERAIASAGGPSGLKCHGMGGFDGFLQEDGTVSEAVAGNSLVQVANDTDVDGTTTETNGPSNLPLVTATPTSIHELAVPTT